MFRKRLDYGLHGYQVPPIPRAARSARRRGPIFRKKVQDNQMCAFDLLATVAGKLLEGESFALATTLTPKDEGQRVDAQENDTEDQNEGVLRASDDKVEAQENDTEDQSEGVLRAGDDKVHPGINLPVNEVISSVQDHYCRETVVGMGTGKNEMGCHSSKLSDSDKKNFGCHLRKLGGSYTSSCGHVSCVVPNIEDCITPVMSSMPVDIGHVSFGTGPDTCGLEDPKLCPHRKSTIIGSYSHGNGTSLCKENCSIVSCTVSRDNLKVISRDNDENFSVCSGRSMKIRKSRSVSHIGNRRVRKLLASRCWSVAPKMKSRDISDNGKLIFSGGEFQSIYHSRKTGYKRRRSHWFYPLKKRKFFRCISKSGEGIGRDCIYKSAQGEAMDMSGSYLGAMWHGAIGKSALVAEQSPASMQSRDSHVKLRIKSFRVPELFIELPETATVGSLKKAVMDAVTALLGSGLHIGLLLQGKKIRDDGKTLLQSGITHDDGVDTLAFSLEPNLSQVLQVDSSEDRCVVVTSDEPQPVLRYPAATSTAIHEGNSHASAGFPVTNLGENFIDSDHDSAPSPAENFADKSAHVSRVLVAVPEGNAEPLAAVPPINQRRKRPDMAHRRIRRPFSIAEVEALVHAVEKLGTGRWRDVKLRAFDNMRHRTYVDLKDKWKTLVHTTRIPPQQRRGEPVPQELLDRVTVAQAYWSKQQAKHQHEAACLLS